MRSHRLSLAAGCVLFLVLFGILSLANMEAAPASTAPVANAPEEAISQTSAPAPQAPAASGDVLMPVIFDPAAQPIVFDPPADTVLPGGNYTFISMTIRAGVTVTATGGVHITVLGDAEIAGELLGDCTHITVLAQGDLTVTGVVDNECSGDATNPGDISLYSDGGNMAIGTIDTPVTLRSSGGLDVGNDPHAQEWEFDVLPHQRATSPLAPVCSATADTLVDSVFAGSSVEVTFTGEGVDPDGGPVYYTWDFGDGATGTGQEPIHAYDVAGVYDVTLTVTDDDDQTCEATLRIVLDDGDETGQPDEPAVAAEPQRLVVATGEDAYFTGDALDPAGGEIMTYTWELDGVQMSGPAITHTFAMTGRYDVTLTVTDTGGFASTATASVYVYDSAAAPDPAAPAQGNCTTPGPNVFNAVYDGGKAPENRRGRQARFRGQGHIFLGPGTDIQAQHGGDGQDHSGSGTVIARNGRRGGSLIILVRGSLTVCGGARLAAGDGGAGGTATSDTPAPGTAYARGGNGGPAAYRLWIATTQGLAFTAGTSILDPGDGGDGGLGDADGQDGADQCPVAEDGANARAVGGKGGRASKTVVVWGNVTTPHNAQIQGGMGGAGGMGDAFAGYGGAANCGAAATGGDGGWAYARGGRGGDADLKGAFALFTVSFDAFTAGDGGPAESFGGHGGEAVATAPACTAADADGGRGGNARAFGGHGGQGSIDGAGGNGDADGGQGGDATATGGDCDGCGNPGGDATATAGDAGLALARYGRGAPDGSATALARDGGDAMATGGNGGHCDECPGGAGGPGGAADATGGDGGTALGNGTRTAGNGGDGNATGGRGGDGADCCAEPGGDGGDGGAATSTAGDPGAPNGAVGANATSGGDGGHGGDGKLPGNGGAGGTGSGNPVDIPDGQDGEDGELCADIWFIYHSSIDDGAIVPGTVITLSTYITTDAALTPTGQVTLTFMTQPPLEYPPSYSKHEATLQVQGGLQYDLSDIPPSAFPVDSAQATIAHNCQNPECILLIGRTTAGSDLFAGNQLTTTGSTLITETIRLPIPSNGALYEQFTIIVFDPAAFFNFDHWAIIIIDP